MTPSNLAFFGGSFNPPTPAHIAIIEYLCNAPFFSSVVIKPCGFRRDKPDLLTDIQHRSESIQSAFRPVMNSKCRLDLSSINSVMCPTWNEIAKIKERHPDYLCWIIVGTDLFEEKNNQRCELMTWYRGEELFTEHHFFIFPRPNYHNPKLPPHHKVAQDYHPINISSTELRHLNQSSHE